MNKDRRPGRGKAAFPMHAFSRFPIKRSEQNWRKIDYNALPSSSTSVQVSGSDSNAPSNSTSDPTASAVPRGAPNACLFVASLTTSRTESQLKMSVHDHFSKWGKLIDVKVFRDWQHRPYSFVQFESKEVALVALQESKGTLIDGRPIRVEQARVNRALFIVHKEARELNEQEIMQLIGPYGEVETMEILPWSANNQERGLAFVKFCYRDDAIQAYLGIRVNRTWCVDWANHAERLMHPSDKTSLFVGQLDPQEITEEKLRDRFARYGSIAEVILINRPTMNSTKTRFAFAFIRYHNPESASKALAAEDGAYWLNHHISVQYRESREQIMHRRAAGASTTTTTTSVIHPFPTTVGRHRQNVVEETPTSIAIYSASQPTGAIQSTLSAVNYMPPPLMEGYYYPYMPNIHPPSAPTYAVAPQQYMTPTQLPSPTDGAPFYMYTPQQSPVSSIPYKPPVHLMASSSTNEELLFTPDNRTVYKLLTPQSPDHSVDVMPLSLNPMLPTAIVTATVASSNSSASVVKGPSLTADDINYQLSALHMASQPNI
ncbi:hypothetical protein BDF22DRAFT_654354 [Syncephalis plumigaleata]|nr:hypothetical protein BDF22DRAFT_654354 [Syncephalis plumigaleata]